MNEESRFHSEEMEIDLLRLFRAIKKKIGLILLVTVLGGALGFSYAAFLITPLYKSEALMYVNNSSISVGNTKVSISAQDITAAQSLVDTYSVILKTRNTLEDVISKNGLSYTYEELSKMIETAPVNSTEVFTITVTSPSPRESEHIANSIAQILPDKISDIVEGSSVKIVDYAVVPSVKASPNIARYTMLGAIIGLVLICAYVIIRELLNDEVKEEKELQERFAAIPILAAIPDLNQKHSGRYGYYRLHKDSEEA